MYVHMLAEGDEGKFMNRVSVISNCKRSDQFGGFETTQSKICLCVCMYVCVSVCLSVCLLSPRSLEGSE